MKQRPRIYYTESQKALMWDRWKQGDSLQMIGSCSIETTHRSNIFLRRQAAYVQHSAADRCGL